MARPVNQHSASARRQPAPEDHPELAWPALDPELLKALTPITRAVVRALGYGRAREFLFEHGGVNCNIPMHKVQALGLSSDELARLRITLTPHLHRNGHVDFPKADKLFQLARNAQIRQDRSRYSLSQLARANHLTSRHIQNICREEDGDQFSLF